MNWWTRTASKKRTNELIVNSPQTSANHGHDSIIASLEMGTLEILLHVNVGNCRVQHLKKRIFLLFGLTDHTELDIHCTVWQSHLAHLSKSL